MSTQAVAVHIENLHKRFGSVVALDDFSLDIAPAELVALLGPSGCGKTTALRIVAGLERPTAGQILLDGNDIVNLPANKRNMGMVFQAYSLFPAMTSEENVAYGLRVRGVKADVRRKKAHELLELVGLGEQFKRLPSQLSGGQQQRVALARALAIEPSVLLLDEPLSALDAKVRTQLRDEIKRIQVEVGTTTIFVTHDQEEAMAIAGIMSAGKLEQCASPAEVYINPINVSVAKFVGAMNSVPGRLTGAGQAEVLGQSVSVRGAAKDSNNARVLLRPEQLTLSHSSGNSVSTATVTSLAFLGPLTRVSVRTNADQAAMFVALPSADATAFSVGTQVDIKVTATQALVE